MNEIDARRQLLAEPRHLYPTLEAQVHADPKLAAFRASLLSFDNAIAETLGKIVPPKGLADRIILQSRHQQRARWSMALAASVVVTAVVAFSLAPGRPDALTVAMIDHVIESPDELADNGHVSTEQARASLQRIGVSLRDSGYRIRHIGECVIAGRVGRHLVVNTPTGLATLLVLPAELREFSRQRSLSKGNFVAVVIPQSKLAIAAVGAAGMAPQQLESLARQMFTLES